MYVMKRPDCTKCIYYYITLDERHPKACKIFNIKSLHVPSADIKRFTGHECPVFKERPCENKKKMYRESSIIDTTA
ncbi:MAG: hypothetical protein B6229_06440 [Spirochaetaceae bacterium 4572_7]|nr:MAG: hypothetical protein B6229_06440 [Spirochaetaceae bacterium 4572_7]